MPQSILIGSFKLNIYGLLISLSLYLSYFLSSKERDKFCLKQKELDLIYIFSLFLALAGGRLYHVLDWWEYYKNDLIKIFYVQNGGLGIFGSLVFGIFGVLIICRWRGIKTESVLNLVFPNILLAQSIGRLGNFFNMEGYGATTNLPWGVVVNGVKVHPTFFYESVLCLSAFLLIHFFVDRERIGFACYLISYGIIRLITEIFRVDTFTLYGVKIGFMFSLLMLLLGYVILKKREGVRKCQTLKLVK